MRPCLVKAIRELRMYRATEAMHLMRVVETEPKSLLDRC